jgi:hypothetical protein
LFDRDFLRIRDEAHFLVWKFLKENGLNVPYVRILSAWIFLNVSGNSGKFDAFLVFLTGSGPIL